VVVLPINPKKETLVKLTLLLSSTLKEFSALKTTKKKKLSS